MNGYRVRAMGRDKCTMLCALYMLESVGLTAAAPVMQSAESGVRTAFPNLPESKFHKIFHNVSGKGCPWKRKQAVPADGLFIQLAVLLL